MGRWGGLEKQHLRMIRVNDEKEKWGLVQKAVQGMPQQNTAGRDEETTQSGAPRLEALGSKHSKILTYRKSLSEAWKQLSVPVGASAPGRHPYSKLLPEERHSEV